MESRPRRNSIEHPPHFSELMNKLIKAVASLIKQFDNNEPEMREIVRKMETIADKLKEMQETKDRQRKIGAGAGAGVVGVGALLTGFGFMAAPFTGGLSLVGAAGAGGAAVAGGGVGAIGAVAAAAVVGGGLGVGYINITKQRLEKQSANKVEDLGEEFKKIIEPLKETLEEIKTTCEKLEEKSTEDQTENTQEFKEIFREVSELKEKSQEALGVAVRMMQRVTSTPEEDQKLRDTIIQSADQSQKVITGFESMKEVLREFTERDELQSEETETS